MSNFTDAETEALRKLIAHAERDPDFSADEITLIKQVLDAARTLLTLGRFAKWVIFILAALAGGLTAWGQIKEHFAKWLSGL